MVSYTVHSISNWICIYYVVLAYGPLPGFEINGRPVVRDDQNLTLTTKSLNMVAPWTTIGGPHNRFV